MSSRGSSKSTKRYYRRKPKIAKPLSNYEKALTGNKDIDMKILNELDDNDLANACQINRYIKEQICDNQIFVIAKRSIFVF